MGSKSGLGWGIFWRIWLGVVSMGVVCGGLFGFMLTIVATLPSIISMHSSAALNGLVLGPILGALFGVVMGVLLGFTDALVFTALCFDLMGKAELAQSEFHKEVTSGGVWVATICTPLVVIIVCQSFAALLILIIPVLIAIVATVKVNKRVAQWFFRQNLPYLQAQALVG
jgi:hypothetical protein